VSITNLVYKFFEFPDGHIRPILNLCLINPTNHQQFKWHGLVDTGADSCLFNKDICDALGYNYNHKNVKTSTNIGIGKDIVIVYLHTYIIQLLTPDMKKIIWESKPSLIDCYDGNEDLPLILGANDFLKHFVITVDYKKQHTIIHL